MLHALKKAGLVCVSVLAVAAAAQTIEGIDVEAIKGRAAEFQEDAVDLSREVERRTAEFETQAIETSDQAMSAVEQYGASLEVDENSDLNVDLDALAQTASKNMASRKSGAPLFVAFASLSMPEESLRKMIMDVANSGGVVVFRGFTNNSSKQFVAGLTKVLGNDPGPVSMTVDPRLFRAFDVKRVPAYVVSSTDFELCESLTCVTKPPPHDKMTGNVTTGYALESFADAGGPGALIARKALSNLRKNGT